jgi:hypothetical protein
MGVCVMGYALGRDPEKLVQVLNRLRWCFAKDGLHIDGLDINLVLEDTIDHLMTVHGLWGGPSGE